MLHGRGSFLPAGTALAVHKSLQRDVCHSFRWLVSRGGGIFPVPVDGGLTALQPLSSPLREDGFRMLKASEMISGGAHLLAAPHRSLSSQAGSGSRF